MNCLACKVILDENANKFCSTECEASYYDAMNDYNLEVVVTADTVVKNNLEKSGFRNYGDYLTSVRILKN